MRINGYRCDGCGKEHLIPNTSIASMREGIPLSWFLVYHGDTMVNGDPLLYCSETCLRKDFTDTEQRYAVEHFPPEGRTLQELVLDALTTDGPHHTQWYLWRIAEALHVDTSDVLHVAEKGIAP